MICQQDVHEKNHQYIHAAESSSSSLVLLDYMYSVSQNKVAPLQLFVVFCLLVKLCN